MSVDNEDTVPRARSEGDTEESEEREVYPAEISFPLCVADTASPQISILSVSLSLYSLSWPIL